MKVVYVTIEKQIRDAIQAADAHGRRIAHIELTKCEAAELAAALAPMRRFIGHPDVPPFSTVKSGDHYYGVRLEVAE